MLCILKLVVSLIDEVVTSNDVAKRNAESTQISVKHVYAARAADLKSSELFTPVFAARAAALSSRHATGAARAGPGFSTRIPPALVRQWTATTKE